MIFSFAFSGLLFPSFKHFQEPLCLPINMVLAKDDRFARSGVSEYNVTAEKRLFDENENAAPDDECDADTGDVEDNVVQ